MAELLRAPARSRTLQSPVVHLAGRNRARTATRRPGGSRAPGSVVGGRWQDWLAKSREEVEGFKKAQVSSWAEAVLIDGGLEADDELIQQTVTALQQQGVTGKSLRELTLDEQIAAGIPLGPAKLLTKKIQLLQEPQARLENRLLLTLF